MEKVKQLAKKHSDKLTILFIIGASVGLINTFCRADYNFVIYLYMFYVWRYMTEALEIQAREKLTFFYILLYSGLIDIIWCFFWNSKWGLLKEDIESGTHGVVVFCSWMGILLKAAILILIGVNDWNTIKGSLPKSLSEKINSEYIRQIDDRL